MNTAPPSGLARAERTSSDTSCGSGGRTSASGARGDQPFLLQQQQLALGGQEPEGLEGDEVRHRANVPCFDVDRVEPNRRQVGEQRRGAGFGTHQTVDDDDGPAMPLGEGDFPAAPRARGEAIGADGDQRSVGDVGFEFVGDVVAWLDRDLVEEPIRGDRLELALDAQGDRAPRVVALGVAEKQLHRRSATHRRRRARALIDEAARLQDRHLQDPLRQVITGQHLDIELRAANKALAEAETHQREAFRCYAHFAALCLERGDAAIVQHERRRH